jgi:cell division protein FtsI (penicillin-binding protein 3)
MDVTGEAVVVPAVCPLVGGLGRRRTRLLVAGLVLWGVLILGRLAQLMLVPGGALREAVARASWLEGEIPAPRGCILDRNGQPLAWSVRLFQLHWRLPAVRETAEEEYAVLARVLAGLPAQAPAAAAGTELLLKEPLTAVEVAAVARLRQDVPGVRLTSRTVRHVRGSAAVRERVGTVLVRDGVEYGVSGEERFQDAMLRGRPGHFRVMVDRRGRWILDTLEKTVDILPGYDVYLPISAEPLGAPAAAPR